MGGFSIGWAIVLKTRFGTRLAAVLGAVPSLFAAFALLLSSSANANDDYFDAGALDTSIWTIVDPRGDGSITFDATHAIISVPAGTSHDIWTSGNNSNRIMRSAVDDDFTIEVKLDSTVNQRFQLQGILVQQDDDNFIRFDYYSPGTSARAFSATFSNGSPTVRHNQNIGSQPGPLYIRVERVGDTWSHYFSTDGVGWALATTFDYALNVSQVGVFAGNAGSSPAHSTLVDYFLFDQQSGGPGNYTLSTNVTGQGTVAEQPDQPSYSPGASVDLTATPAPGWYFDTWSGDASGMDNPLTLTLNQSLTVTANFMQIPPVSTLAIGEGQVDLAWSAFPGEPVEYQIYRDGSLLGTTTNLSFSDLSLSADGSNYEVRAIYADNSTLSSLQTLPTAVNFTNAPWWNSDWADRELVTAYAAHALLDEAIEIEFDVTNQIANSSGTELDLDSIRCHEVSIGGVVIDENVPCQMDPAVDYDAQSNPAGTLVIYVAGSTPAYTARYFHVYYDAVDGTSKAYNHTPVVAVSDVFDEDQDAFQVTNRTGDFVYQKNGAGFSSLLDLDGNDWISYAPTGGSSGNFRGIPNLLYPSGLFHPGANTGTTTVESSGPVKVVLVSESNDGMWRVRWSFYPSKAVMDVLATDGSYWFLYEGTPGGALDTGSDYSLTPDGLLRPLSESWTADIVNPDGDVEWVAFIDSAESRALILTKNSDDAVIDSYRPMENAMTVFGFGRNGLSTLLTDPAAQFQLQLVETGAQQVVAESASGLTLSAEIFSTLSEPPPIDTSVNLTVSVVGQGTVSKDPEQAEYEEGDQVSLTPQAAIGWSFTGWSGDVNSSDNPLVVTLTDDTDITATFAIDGPAFAVTTQVVGSGTVSLTPDGGTYADGTSVQALAVPAAGWSFLNWTGLGTNNPLALTVDQNITLTAEFEQDPIVPQISNVAANPGVMDATISWQTDIDTTGALAYGLTPALELGSMPTASGTSHSVQLSGLLESTLYYYEITVTSAQNLEATESGSFNTNAEDTGAEYFDDGALNESIWTFVDPRGDSTLSFDATHAIIDVPQGTSHDIWTSGNDSARLMRSVNDEDFVLETKLDSTVGERFQLQGILVEQDADNFIRFDFYSAGSGVRGFAASFSNGDPTVRINDSLGSLPAPLYIRVERVGDSWTQSYSQDGQSWSPLAAFNYNLAVSSVGVFSGNAGPSPQHTVLVDYFLLSQDGPPPPSYTVTTTVSGQGSVSRDPDLAQYEQNSPLTLSATPQAGWLFNGWSGDLVSADNPLNLVVSEDLALVANFVEENLPNYNVSTAVTGNGQVALNPGGGTYVQGSVIQAQATPDLGWTFTGWQGLSDTSNPLTLTVTADVSLTAQFENVGPTAVISTDVVDGFKPLTVNFDGSNSTDLGGAIVSWDWTFGDGGLDASGEQVSYEFTSTGTFTVTLTVTDDQGATDSISTDITVSSDNITALASLTATEGTLEVTFDGSASSVNTGSIVSWDWDFGDGSSASGAQVAHTYAAQGNYAWSLTVTDSFGDQEVISDTERVTDGLSTRVADGLVVLYEIGEGAGSEIMDTSANGEPMNLQIVDTADISWIAGGISVNTPAEIRTQGPATKLIDAVQVSGAFTMEAWMRTSDLSQNGPARVVSLSNSPSLRNVTLGQGVYNRGGDRIEVRTRTTGTSNNGTPGTSTPNGTLTTDMHHVVFTYAASGTGTVYIDGVQQGSSQLNGDLSNWDPGYSLNLANEQSGDRPWLGELHLVAFYDKALSVPEVQQNFGAGPDGDQIVVLNYSVNTVLNGQGSVTTDPDSSSFPDGSTVTLTATGGIGWAFDSWSGDLSGSENPISFAIEQDMNVTANFSEIPIPDFDLTTAVIGSGQVSLDPTGGTYAQGTVVQALATADAGWAFDGWVGLSSSDNPLAITVLEDTTLTAEFVDLPPVAVISSDIQQGSAPLTVNFDGSGSSDGAGSVVAWAWSFGDGSSDNSGPNVSHVFVSSGMYTVTLTVTDNAGGMHSTTQTIVVNSANITPVAEATSAPGTLDANFDATGSSALSGSLVSWEWDLGDGTSSNGEEVSHTYAQAGEYDYTLTVTDSAGGQAFATGSILVNDIVIERVSDGLVALYELNEGGGAVVGDTSGQGNPLNLDILDTNEVTWIPGGLRVDTSAEIRSPGPATKLIDAARTNNAFTMEAWLKTEDLTQNGPARIVSISENSSSRNLTLGQGVYNNGGDRIEVRARTSDTSNNGQPSTATEQGSLTTDLQHVVFTIDDQGTTTIYIDGVQRASEEIGGDLSNWDTDHVLSLANEASGDRPWLGELHLVAFYDRALPYSEVTQNFAAGAEGEGLGYDLAPIVVVESDRLAGVMPLLVNFDGSNSFDIDGMIVSHAWDFGDGNSSAAANAQHTYTTPGEFTATLTVTDNFGNSRSSSVEINVIDPANIPEIVVYDWNKPVTTAQRGFANINNPTGEANGDWTFPIDYRDGTFYIRAEVRSQPVPQSMHVQFCIWQYNLTRETCTSTEPIEGQPGTVMTTSQTIASMWKKGGKALDWDQPRQRYGMPVKDAQKQPVSDFLNWNWQGYDPDDWYPLDIRYTVVLVAPGATFSGWENYVD